MTSKLFALVRVVAPRATRHSLFAVAMFASFMLVAMQPAQAQSADTWKSVAIIGGSTAAGAYVGHKVAGPIGTVVGAGVGATAGYAIDRHRRQNEYYNGQYAYGNGGYYPNAGGYDGNNRGRYGDGGYYGDVYDGGAYRPGYMTSNYYGNSDRCSRR